MSPLLIRVIVLERLRRNQSTKINTDESGKLDYHLSNLRRISKKFEEDAPAKWSVRVAHARFLSDQIKVVDQSHIEPRTESRRLSPVVRWLSWLVRCPHQSEISHQKPGTRRVRTRTRPQPPFQDPPPMYFVLPSSPSSSENVHVRVVTRPLMRFHGT